MNIVLNPFSPGAGTPPPALVGRQELLEKARVAVERVRALRSEKSLLLVGLCGVGKTVLLRTIADMAEELRCQVIFIETPEDQSLPELLAPPLREALLRLDAMAGLNEKVKRALRVFRSFLGTIKLGNEHISMEIDPEFGTGDSGNLQADLSALFLAVAEAAKARGTALVLILDELQYLREQEFRALITALHAVGQKQLPLLVFGAGLPQLVGLAGKAKSYAERLFLFPAVGPLGLGEATDALQRPVKTQNVEFTEGALRLIFELTRGYPYFLQEWGYELWNFAQSSPITEENVAAATPGIIRKLDENFFRVRFDRLTPSEKKYLRAMAELGDGPHRSGDLAAVLKAPVQSVAPVRSSLIRKGMTYSPAHGDIDFTVPLFAGFMRRVMSFEP
jgi:hypothetical protein